MSRWIQLLLPALLIWFLMVPSEIRAAEYDQDKGVFGEQMEAYLNTPYVDEPDLMEKKLAKMLISPANWILNAFAMQDPVILVFGKNPAPVQMVDVYEKGGYWECIWNSAFSSIESLRGCLLGKKVGERQDDFLQGDCVGKTDCRNGLALGVLSEGMMSAVDVLYSVFEVFLPFPIVLGLMMIGIWLIWKSMSSSGRSETKEYISAFVVGLLALRYGYYLWSLVGYVVDTFTSIIWATLQMMGVKQNLMLYMIWGNGHDGYGNLVSMRGLAIALIVVAATIMTFMLNYQYIVRAIMLMVLLAMFPVVCTLTIFPKFRHSLQTWWDEFLVNMILPVGHALALGLFFLLLHYSSTGISVWVIIAYFFGLPTIAALVRKLIMPEYQGGMKGGASAMVGIAGMMSMKRMLSPKGSSTGGSRQAAGSAGGREDSSEGNEAAAGGVAVGGLAGILSGSGSGAVGKVAGFGLKAAGVAGMAAAATTGFVVGTMAGNPSAGLAGGVLAGKGLNKVGGAFTSGAASAASKGAAWISSKSPSPQAASSAPTPSTAVVPVPSPNPSTPSGATAAPAANGLSGVTASLPSPSLASPSSSDSSEDGSPAELVRSQDEAGNEIWKPDYRPKPGDPGHYNYDV